MTSDDGCPLPATSPTRVGAEKGTGLEQGCASELSAAASEYVPRTVKAGSRVIISVVDVLANKDNTGYLNRTLSARKAFVERATDRADGFTLRETYGKEIEENSREVGRDRADSASVLQLLRRLRAKNSYDRLSPIRVVSALGWFKEKLGQDYARVLDISTVGVELFLDNREVEYRPLATPPSFFPKEEGLGHAFEAAMNDVVLAGRAVLVDTRCLVGKKGVNFIPLAAVEKEKGCKEGRVRQIFNASKGDGANNWSGDKERIIGMYGSMTYPTLASMACLVWHLVLKHGSERLSLAVEDVAAFYNQLPIRRDQALLQCAAVSQNVTAVSDTAIFGSNSAGFAAGAVSRTFKVVMEIEGAPGRDGNGMVCACEPRRPARFVIANDDALMCGLTDEMCGAPGTMGIVARFQHLVTDLLGPTAIDSFSEQPRQCSTDVVRGKKLQLGDEVVYMGYVFSLVHGVRFKQQRLQRALNSLLVVVNNLKVTVRELMSAAAVCSQLGTLIPACRLVSPMLYSGFAGSAWSSVDVVISPRPEVVYAATAALTWAIDFDEAGVRASLPFNFVVPGVPPRFLISSDASIHGVGYRVLQQVGEPPSLLDYTRDYNRFEGVDRPQGVDRYTDRELQEHVARSQEAAPSMPYEPDPSKWSLLFAGGFPNVWAASHRRQLELDGLSALQIKRRVSALQNASEYAGFLVALALLASQGHRGEKVTALLDSTTALSWGTAAQAKSQYSRRAVFTQAAVEAYCGLHTNQGAYVNSEAHALCDRLSRSMGSSELRAELTAQGVPEDKWLFPTAALLDLIDPLKPWVENNTAIVDLYIDACKPFSVIPSGVVFCSRADSPFPISSTSFYEPPTR